MLGLLTWTTSFILAILSGLHVYWVLGGTWGLEATIPHTGKDRLFEPGKMGTSVIALLLALGAWFVLELGGLVRVLFSYSLLPYGAWILFIVFMFRAVGDFRWVGFFKRKKGTMFAKWDSILFSPLCVFLASATLVIMYLRTD
ncbi:DUF3995 domain-containing protein [Paenibacillus sp. PCH8]|uniref:DUF3995 domain-containing protein n=1 Tax=Paenibacillus sp. PCH8 TaxID=2066524 RepID=UPI000CF88BF2|nr:DUF3995 domain-containing protein [Paenibacillus sp. PCH8]PQP83893.1 DUF3995 domain-containing protein [Paenibacillus sp. PCH8]